MHIHVNQRCWLVHIIYRQENIKTHKIYSLGIITKNRTIISAIDNTLTISLVLFIEQVTKEGG